ncbi:MAG: ROK family transcriptional regulator [Spirochaetaceae bacterium]|nr:MAG: ROK family transcriptional regulator [Spirochaetaceae bacterium]
MNGAALPLVMRTLRREGAMPRVELARRLGLDRSTVSYVANFLIGAGVVAEAGVGDASRRGGRRPVVLAIRDEQLLAAGVELTAERFRAVILDNAGRLRLRTWGRNRHPDDPAAAVEAACRALMSRAVRARLVPFAVGVALPGIVDPARGMLVRSDALQVEAVSIAMQTAGAGAGRAAIPVIVDNDANCCAWGELHPADGAGLEDLLCVLGRRTGDLFTVGLGLVTGGTVYRGRRFRAGEFFSVKAKPGGGPQFGISQELLRSVPHDSAATGHVVGEMVESLGPLIGALDPARLVLGGELRGARDQVVRKLCSRPGLQVVSAAMGPVEVAVSRWGRDDVCAGAAGMVFEQLYACDAFDRGPLPNGVTWRDALAAMEPARG